MFHRPKRLGPPVEPKVAVSEAEAAGASIEPEEAPTRETEAVPAP